MEVKNKFGKILTGFAGASFVATAVMGIKIGEDNKRIAKLEEDLNGYNSSMAEVLDTQKQIISGREAILGNLAKAAAPETTKKITSQTVLPGKTVTQKVPVATKSSSKSSSSKSASSSSSSSKSSKTTGTS